MITAASKDKILHKSQVSVTFRQLAVFSVGVGSRILANEDIPLPPRMAPTIIDGCSVFSYVFNYPAQDTICLTSYTSLSFSQSQTICGDPLDQDFSSPALEIIKFKKKKRERQLGAVPSASFLVTVCDIARRRGVTVSSDPHAQHRKTFKKEVWLYKWELLLLELKTSQKF